MQQHPFGPIENQLIVGYYKRGKAFSNLKPAFKLNDGPIEGDDQRIYTWVNQPVFYGWSPANGNSSSHDFRVGCMPSEAEWSESLLSRGLGYRITFTMPDQKRGGKKNTAAPEFELEIVDLFGEKVFRRFEDNNPQNFEWLDESIQSTITKYKSFQIEVTPLHVKIVQNHTIEHYSPIYRPPGTPNLVDPEVLLSKFDWLVEVKDYEETTADPFNSGFRHHLSRIFQTLSRAHSEISLSARSRLGAHLKVLIDIFIKFCYAGREEYVLHDPSMLPFLDSFVAGLDTKLMHWLDGVGEYPLHLNAAFIEAVCDRITRISDEGEDSEDHYKPECKFEEVVLAAGYPPENFLFLSMGKLPEIFDAYMRSLIRVYFGYSGKSRSDMRTQTFTVMCFGTVQEQLPFQYYNTLEPDQLFEVNINPKIGNNIKYEGQVIPVYGTDWLLGCPTAGDLRRRCFLVDLSAAVKTRDKTNSQASIKVIEGALIDSSPADERVFASAQGISLLGINKEDKCPFLQFHSFTKKAKGWAYLELGQPQLRFGQFDAGSVLQETRTGRIFAIFGEEHVPSSSEMKVADWTHNFIQLACCQYDSKHNKLALVYQSTLTWTGTMLECQSVWIESRKTAYACIFSCSPPRLWVAANQSRRFVAIGSRHTSKLKAFELSDHLESLEPLRTITQKVGIMGKFRPERQADGSDKYQFGRLYFRY